MLSRNSDTAVIGAGKLAYSLINAANKSGYKIKIIVSSNLNSAKFLAERFSIKKYSDNLNEINSKIKIFFLSVPDNQIKIISEDLSGLNLDFRKSLFIHFSGAENITKLEPLEKKGALTASFHIMQTFPSRRIVNIKGCYAAVETNDKPAERFLFNLSKDLQLKAVKIKPEDKTGYHLAGVFASNFLVGNIFNSEILFNIKDYNPDYKNFDFLLPIIKSTLNNISKLGSSAALSGPIERGELSTIKEHLSFLKKIGKENKKSNLLISGYIVQSLNLLRAVKEKYKKLDKKHLMLQKYLLDELEKFGYLNNELT